MSTENKPVERELTPAQKLLDQPITSREQLQEIINILSAGHDIYISTPKLDAHRIPYNKNDLSRRAPLYDIGYLSTSDSQHSGDAWWLMREYMREQVGLYPEPSPTIQWLRSYDGMAGHYFPHVSKTDPNMVAFTPDHTAGINDRQVKTSVGKLLRRFLPLLNDEQVAALEAMHRAEMSSEFLVAETIEDVERVYTTMAGDSGCMRYPKRQWQHTQYHPSAVYARPQDGVRVAYLADGNGKPVARTVIYDNPDDLSDKRYVRLYGAHKRLEAILKRQGYVCGGLNGAKINALIDPSRAETEGAMYKNYVTPYLDSPGGGVSSRQRGTCVYKMDNEDFLRVCNEDQADRVSTLAANVWDGDSSRAYADAQHTGGYSRLREIPHSALEFTCDLTGESYSAFTESRVKWLTAEGKIVHAAASNLPVGHVNVRALHQGEHITVWASPDNPHIINAGRFGWVHNDAENLTSRGVMILSAKHYPETVDAEGKRLYGAYVILRSVRTTLDGDVILRSDAVELFDVHPESGEEITSYVHMESVRKLGKMGFVSTPVKGGERKWIKKGHSLHVVTGRGRDAIRGVHNLVLLSNGKWEFERNVAELSVGGCTFYYDVDTRWEDMEFSKDVLGNQFRYDLNNAAARATCNLDNNWTRDREWVLCDALSAPIRRGTRWTVAFKRDDEGKMIGVSSYTQVTPELYRRVLAAAQTINAADDATLVELGFGGDLIARGVRVWARMLVTADAFVREYLDNLERSEAAARAQVEAVMVQMDEEAAEADALLAELAKPVQITRDDQFAAAA